MSRPLLGMEFESYDVLAALAPHAMSYLCVGVSEGECLRRVVRANPLIGRLALCDTWGAEHGGTGRGTHEHIKTMLYGMEFRGTVKYLDGNSQALVPRLTEDYDLSYVDASHAEEDEFADLCNVWERTKWALVVHDARMPQVWSAINRWLDRADATDSAYCSAGHGTLTVYV